MSKADNKLLEALHNAVAQDLIQKIMSGEAKAADLSVAVKFLKDNGIEALPTATNPVGKLLDALPFDAAGIDAMLSERH